MFAVHGAGRRAFLVPKTGTRGKPFRFLPPLAAAGRRKLDIVMAGSVDRLGRSLHDLVGFLREVQAPGIDPYLHHQAIDTTSPAGKALFQMPGVFAGFGREMIRSNSP